MIRNFDPNMAIHHSDPIGGVNSLKLSSIATSEVLCDLPEAIENGGYPSPSAPGVRVGQSLAFTCNSGYEMDGLPSLECLEDGTWSDLPPTCQPVPCSQPPV